ncbi:MAG: (2Fe-2S)-binding protein, partial [Phycisphaerae bacterium]|nr:(2Fe-2S)-binding protein [Phycisphaerae bacterium]
MVKLTLNDRHIEAREGELLIDAMERAGVRVPTLCHMKDLFPSGACRMCVVEIDGRRGLVPSCACPVEEGMDVKTHSSRVVRARKTIIELLLANHPDDCLYCVRNGNCQLQDLAEELGVRERRFTGGRSHHDLDVSNPAIERDPDKCILCGKCVRICEEVQGVAAIDFVGRGSRAMVGTAFDQGLNLSSCVNCGQCIMVCPTGALRERSSLKDVMEAISDPDTFVVVQHAPSISVTLGEEFGLKP